MHDLGDRVLVVSVHLLELRNRDLHQIAVHRSSAQRSSLAAGSAALALMQLPNTPATTRKHSQKFATNYQDVRIFISILQRKNAFYKNTAVRTTGIVPAIHVVQRIRDDPFLPFRYD